jgi:hypothetical protein
MQPGKTITRCDGATEHYVMRKLRGRTIAGRSLLVKKMDGEQQDMTDPISRASVALKLRLLLATRYLELLSVIVVLSIPKVILFLTGGTHSESSGPWTALYGLIPMVSDFVVFPGCLLATLYINRSVLRAEPASLLQEFRLAARGIVTYFVLAVIEYGPLIVALEIIRRSLVAAHVVEKGNVLFSAILSPFAAAIVRFVFLFSLPLLVSKSVANLKNVKQSLELFNRHKAGLLSMLSFSLLIVGIGLPESFHFVSRSEHLLMIDLAREVVVILFYVLSMNYYAFFENID